MLNQGYVPCDRQIHIKLSEAELQMIRDRMAQMGFKNLSAYVRKMAIDGYCTKPLTRWLFYVLPNPYFANFHKKK